jgi:hypothetical protein
VDIVELKEAIESGHKASSILKETLEEISELYCPEALGFEGPATFSDCGKCIICQAKILMGKE